MPTTRRLGILLLAVLSSLQLSAQLSENARISVITCGPGEPLYSKFGHSAFRVSDPALGIDLVYNYGTFDFTAPGFYTSFAKGQLLYFLSRSRYQDFLYAYQLEGRWVKEQVLDLPPDERAAVFEYLEWNYEPENRYYRYDFLQENCSTKIPDVLKASLEDALYLDPSYLEEEHTYRTLIQAYLQTNSWGSLGIDLALGSVIDRDAGPEGHLFLPDFVYQQMAAASLQGKPLVNRERELLDAYPRSGKSSFFLTPLFWILLLTVVGMAITLRKNTGKPLIILDGALFLLTGLCGVLITFLWWFTDHTATQWNFNILWAFPLNLVMLLPSRMLPGKEQFKKYYLLTLLVLLLSIPVLWLAGVQVFHSLLIPVWLLLALRYSVLYRYFCNS